MLRRIGRAAAPLALVALAGCFVYVPARMETVPAGERVRVRLSGTALTEVAEATPGAGSVVRGTFVRRDQDKLYLRVPVAMRRDGFENRAIEQEVGIAPGQIVEFELRRRSGTRTALLAAGTGGMAALVVGMILEGHGQRTTEPVDGEVEIRVPLGR